MHLPQTIRALAVVAEVAPETAKKWLAGDTTVKPLCAARLERAAATLGLSPTPKLDALHDREPEAVR